jgi:hypothetical protein
MTTNETQEESLKQFSDKGTILWIGALICVAVLVLLIFIYGGISAINYQTEQALSRQIKAVEVAAKNERDKIADEANRQIGELLEKIASGDEELKKAANDAAKRTVNQIITSTEDTKKFAQTVVPRGTIVAFSGTVPLPAGWAICDGKKGTPNLQGRFIRGYGEKSGKLGSSQPESNSIKGSRTYSGSNGIGGSKHVNEVISSGQENYPAHVVLYYIMKIQ